MDEYQKALAKRQLFVLQAKILSAKKDMRQAEIDMEVAREVIDVIGPIAASLKDRIEEAEKEPVP